VRQFVAFVNGVDKRIKKPSQRGGTCKGGGEGKQLFYNLSRPKLPRLLEKQKSAIFCFTYMSYFFFRGLTAAFFAFKGIIVAKIR